MEFGKDGISQVSEINIIGSEISSKMLNLEKLKYGLA
jgi:hypothetical protein